jgi:hypothetical protein
MYFEDHKMYEWLLDGQEFAFGWRLVDNSGNIYDFNLPRCKMTEDPINVTSGDEDVMENATFEALAENNFMAQIAIHRFPVNRTI